MNATGASTHLLDGDNSPEGVTPRHRRIGLALALALVAPNLVWVLSGREPFGGDASQYAEAAIDLYRTLTRSPAAWPEAMLRVLPLKPPGLEWFGQLFVPLAFVFGSAGKALLLSIVATQVIALCLLHAAVAGLAGAQRGIAAVAVTAAAGAPLFVTSGSAFMVESMQLLAVTWFLFIAASSWRWPPSLVLAQLVAATAFALLTKTTTPIFCAGPGILALGNAFANARRGVWGWRHRSTGISFLAAAALGIGAFFFYAANWALLVSHFRNGFSGPIAAYWGGEDAFLATATYWCRTFARRFVSTPGLLFAGLALAGALLLPSREPSRIRPHFARCAAASALQILLVLLLFSLSANRMPRFALPLLPHFALILAWAVARIRFRAVAPLTIALFVLQWAYVYASAFDVMPYRRDAIRPIDRTGARAALLADLVERTCPANAADAPQAGLAIIAIDPSFRGDWLAPAPATMMVAERQLLRPGAPRCNFDSPGRSFFGLEAEAAWSDLLKADVTYVVALDPAIHRPAAKTFNTALDRADYPYLWERLTSSGAFAREQPLAGEPGIVVFRRIAPAVSPAS